MAEALEILDVKLVQPVEPEPGKPSAWPRAGLRCIWAGAMQARKADDLIRKCVAWTWRVKLSLSTERDLFTRLRDERRGGGDQGVCRQPARPAAGRALPARSAVMGLDPGIRTGVKVAVVDATGKLVADEHGLSP